MYMIRIMGAGLQRGGRYPIRTEGASIAVNGETCARFECANAGQAKCLVTISLWLYVCVCVCVSFSFTAFYWSES